MPGPAIWIPGPPRGRLTPTAPKAFPKKKATSMVLLELPTLPKARLPTAGTIRPVSPRLSITKIRTEPESLGRLSEQTSASGSFDSGETSLPSTYGRSEGPRRSMGGSPNEGQFLGSLQATVPWPQAGVTTGKTVNSAARVNTATEGLLLTRTPTPLSSHTTGGIRIPPQPEFHRGKRTPGVCHNERTPAASRSAGAQASFSRERESGAIGWKTGELAGDSASPDTSSLPMDSPAKPSDRSLPQTGNATKPPLAEASPGEIPGLLPAEPPPDTFTFLSDLCYELFAILSVSGVALILLKLLAPKRRALLLLSASPICPNLRPILRAIKTKVSTPGGKPSNLIPAFIDPESRGAEPKLVGHFGSKTMARGKKAKALH